MESMFVWARWQRYFSDIDEARRWYERVPDPLIAADWYFAGVRNPMDAAECIRLKETPKTLRAWRLSGFTDVSRILGWVRIGQSIELAKRWSEIGFGNPESAGKWVSLVNSPESLREWLGKGVESPEELAILLDQGVTLELVGGLDIKSAPTEGWKSWTQLTTQGQVADPEVVNSWLLAHIPLSEAEKWVDVGATPFERDLLVSNGVSLEMLQKLRITRCYELARNIRSRHQDLGEWIENGFKYPEMMAWKQIGISIEEVLDWQAVDVSSESAKRFVSLGFTPAEYLEHLSNPLVRESILLSWEHSGLPARSVKIFVLGGVPDPEIARKWLDGFGSDPIRAVEQYRAYGGDYRQARAADRQAERISLSPSSNPISSLRMESTHEEHWRILEVPESMSAVYESAGFTPDDYLMCLGSDRMSAKNLWSWIFSEIPTESIRSWVMAGVPSPETAIEWMRELRETPEITMINYRHFGGDLVRAKAWFAQLSLLNTSGISNSGSTPAPLGRPVTPIRQHQLVVSSRGFPWASAEWLEEIVARARTVQPSIRKVPHWPARFDDDGQGLVIQLEQFPRAIKGVVKVASDRRWCEFDPSTFEIASECESGEDRYVAGLSICWFIDCSITIHRPAKGSPRLFTALNAFDSKTRTQQVRYVPTPTFNERRREVQPSGSRLTIRHKVSGHLRKLPPGRRGSKQARSNAPVHLRKNMSQFETYVEPHFRGTEVEKAELFTRLSRYSALGDAMSDLDLG